MVKQALYILTAATSIVLPPRRLDQEQFFINPVPGVQIHFAIKFHPASNPTPFDGLAELFLSNFENGVFRGRVVSISSISGVVLRYFRSTSAQAVVPG